MTLRKILPGINIWALIILLMLAGAGCKGKKAALSATDPAAERAKIENEAAARRQQEEEANRRREMEEQARLAEARNKEAEPYRKLENYFAAIANSNNLASANGSINEALTLFADRNTPVLIVISESAGQKDYDRPTTINQYLNYLKDQKKNPNRINHLVFDGSGKITEVELIKN